ncbi:Fic family protein [Sinanaerobacter chloroacetimidivorans]|uniref:Fic family protein n=1 Tax=Sinanaerobacter chloroacetimidivorans TaxID=2818044 RepID=A0A8J7W7F2_9FIRM|nr:Fic family protein [Sinanaerobacter chloroacetimidivorans]MBR0600346.1 Fic family protein [Sinanaerobacter chloroacetimidivorans]
MFREIKKKKLILDNRKPYTREIANYIDELNVVDWIYTTLRLDGSNIGKISVQRILKGELVSEATLNDHANIGNYHDTIKLAYDMADMEIELNEKYLFRFYQSFAKPEKLEYRRTNPVLFMLDYNPPHPSEIEEQMDILIQWMNLDDFQGNPILRAAYLHNKIIEIYPFETHSEAVARMAMYYELIKNGYPPVLLSLSESEYYSAVRQYLRNEKIQPMYEPLERGVYNKLEILMQLTAVH